MMNKLIWVWLLIVSTSAHCQMSAINFFQEQSLNNVLLSPNGLHVAAIRSKKSIEVFNVEQQTWKSYYTPESFPDRKGELNNIFWLGNSHLGAELVTKKRGVKMLLDTKQQSNYLIFELSELTDKNKIYKIKSRGLIENTVSASDGKFLFSKAGPTSRVYELTTKKLNRYGKRLGKFDKVDGGQLKAKNVVAEVKGYVFRWFISRDGEPLNVLFYDPKSEQLTLATLSEGKVSKILNKWTDIDSLSTFKRRTLLKNETQLVLTSNSEMQLIPISKGPKASQFYALDIKADENNDVYLVDYEAQTYKSIYHNSAYKILSIELDPVTNLLNSVQIIRNDIVEVDYLAEDGKPLAQVNNNEMVVMLGQSSDNKAKLIYNESFMEPGRFIVEVQGKNIDVGAKFSHINNLANITLEKGKLPNSDNELTYFLSYPAVASKEKFPLVIFPHGGPIGVFDHSYFNLETQFLNQQGFAVLRINYRGSGGYSKEFVEAGKNQWGSGILDDIIAATKYAKAHAMIDGDKTCILGASYGGYAATMLSIQYPSLFKCGVSIAGVQDLFLTLTSTNLSKKQHMWAKEYIADLETETDTIEKWSSVFHVENLEVPLLVMHGYKDTVVDVEHANRIRSRLDYYSKPYEFHVFEGSGHNFGHEQDRAEMFNKAITFIKKNLDVQ